MSMRISSAFTLFVLCAGGCGGGGGSSVSPAGGGAGGGAGGAGGRTILLAPASTTSVLVHPASEAALTTLCVDTGAKVLAACTGTDYSLVGVPAGSDVPAFLKDLESDASVVDAAPDAGVEGPEGGGSTIPAFGDDPFSVVATQTAMQRVGAVKARSRGLNGDGVLVAVIDSGVAFDHALLQGHLSPNGYDFIEEDSDPSDVGNGLDDNEDGRIDEGVGHGTFVASLILGVAPKATILPIRALNSDGVGTASGVARAIAYAVTQGASVINFSGGLSADLRLIQQAVAFARGNGVLVFASAGNRASAVEFPAIFPEVEAVTAVDNQDRKASFASFGPEVDLCAPGVDLIGAHPLSPSGTARWSGTSFSCALATGCYALVRQWDGRSAALDLVERLEAKATSVSAANPVYGPALGRGRVNADTATR